MTYPQVSDIPVSTVPAVKLWLQNAILTNVTQETGHLLTVCLDDPGVEQPDDIISIGSVHRTPEAFQMIGSMGAGSMAEKYELTVEVSVFRGGPDQLWPWNRAWTLASVVEAVMRADPTCGGNVIESRPHSSRDRSEWTADHKGRLVTVEIMLYVIAQI